MLIPEADFPHVDQLCVFLESSTDHKGGPRPVIPKAHCRTPTVIKITRVVTFHLYVYVIPRGKIKEADLPRRTCFHAKKSHKCCTGVSKDCWNQLPHFVEVVGKVGIDKYDDEFPAWPVLFDDFVEYVQAEQAKKKEKQER